MTTIMKSEPTPSDHEVLTGRRPKGHRLVPVFYSGDDNRRRLCSLRRIPSSAPRRRRTSAFRRASQAASAKVLVPQSPAGPSKAGRLACCRRASVDQSASNP